MLLWYKYIIFILLCTACVSTPTSPPIPSTIWSNAKCNKFEGKYFTPDFGDMVLIACKEGRDIEGALVKTEKYKSRAVELKGVFVYSNTFLMHESDIIWDQFQGWCPDTRYNFTWEDNKLYVYYLSVDCNYSGLGRLYLTKESNTWTP